MVIEFFNKTFEVPKGYVRKYSGLTKQGDEHLTPDGWWPVQLEQAVHNYYFVITPTMLPCCDCKVDVYELKEYAYMLKQWFENIRFLCIGCVEQRLKRELRREDFDTRWPINHYHLNQSDRLKDRLSRAGRYAIFVMMWRARAGGWGDLSQIVDTIEEARELVRGLNPDHLYQIVDLEAKVIISRN